MSEKTPQLSAIPGVGLIVVALAFLFGVSPNRKVEDSKAEIAPRVSVTNPGAEPDDKPLGAGHIRFLEKKGLMIPGRAGPVSHTRFLILTLPDPVDSQFGYWYDQAIDALTRAMTDLNDRYSLADRWFPWTVVSEDKTKNEVVRAGSPKSEPGVVIYQKNKNPDEW